MSAKVQQLASLDLDDWRLLLSAVGWLAFVRAALRLWSFPRVERWASPPLGSGPGNEQRIVRLVTAAGRHLPWQPTCLERSLVLQRLLTRCGIQTQLCIGVRKEGQQLTAHAWLEREGRVVNDSPQAAETYTRLLSPEAMYGAARHLATGRNA